MVEQGYGAVNSNIDAMHIDRAGKTDTTQSWWLYSSIISILIVGPLNFVSYKIMYSAYGESRAFFVSQGVNFLYVVYGGFILHGLTRRGEITDEMKQIPHRKFIIMGFLDSVGGFLAAMGANRTSGSLQQLLNQTLIPITMLLSWLLLGKHSTPLQLVGASLIFVGAWVVLIPSAGEAESYYDITSNLLYFLSNIPIAFSCIYKEMGFRNLQVHVMYMTQLVSVYQLLWGFVLGVLQMLPGIGSAEGSSLSEIFDSFCSGVACFIHYNNECSSKHTFWLLTGYCVLNFILNILGLYLVKHDGAVLSTLTNALLLPLTVLTFNLPLLGEYREEFNPMTVVGLGVVLVGFTLWRVRSFRDEEAEDRLSRYGSPVVSCGAAYTPMSRSGSLDSLDSAAPDAFYDRVIVLSLDK